MSTIITDNPYTFTVADNMNINAVFEDNIPITVKTNGNNAFSIYLKNTQDSTYTWNIPKATSQGTYTYTYTGSASGFALDNIKTLYTFTSYPSSVNNSAVYIDIKGLSITYLPNYAFCFFKNLKTIYLPATLKTVGQQAFQNWYMIDTVYCYAEIPPTCGTNAIQNWHNSSSNTLRIYVPSASVSAYKSASGWSTYASNIQALP